MKGRNIDDQGAHALNYNTISIGICVLGNYDIRSFENSQEESLIDLIAWLCYKYDISTSKIIGHCDVSNKSCPGDNIYDRMPSIRGAIIAKLNEDIQP